MFSHSLICCRCQAECTYAPLSAISFPAIEFPNFPRQLQKAALLLLLRGAAAWLMFTLIAQSPWHLKTKQINVEKKQAKQHRKKATMAMPQCFFSTISQHFPPPSAP